MSVPARLARPSSRRRPRDGRTTVATGRSGDRALEGAGPAGAFALQRSAGNAAVQHLLAQRDGEGDGEEATAPAETVGGGGSNPVDDFIRDTVRDAVGGDKLEGWANDAIEAAVDALRERAEEEGELLSDEVARRLVHTAIQDAMQADIREWLNSDEGQAARRQLAETLGDNPGAVILLAVVGVAVAAAANVDIPELSEDIDIADGFGVTVGTSGGPVQELMRSRLQAGLRYTGEYLGTSVGGSYEQGADRPGGALASLRVGREEGPRVEARASAEFDGQGNLETSLETGLHYGVFGLSGGFTRTVEPEEGAEVPTPTWSGRVQLELGGEEDWPSVTGTAHIGADGQVRLVFSGNYSDAFDVDNLDLRLSVEQPEAGATPGASAGVGYQVPTGAGAPTIRLDFTAGLSRRELSVPPGGSGADSGTTTVQELHGMGVLTAEF